MRSVLSLIAAGCLLLAVGFGAAQEQPSRQTALSVRVVLKVVHPDQARRSILSQVRQRGGFHTLLSDGRLSLKVPPHQLTEVLQVVSKEGLVVEKSLERKDLTEQIAQLEGRLRSKGEILGKLRAFFDDSDLQATLEIERNMRALVEEMEQVKGTLRLELDRARWAVVEIHFQCPERRRVVYKRSPFRWLNSVDLQRFLRRFREDG